MVYKVEIKDNHNTPIGYLPDLDNFKNGTEYIFKPGVNIIVGENGCGKTTLMNLVKKYLMVDYTECDKGMYRCNINSLYNKALDRETLSDGVNVYADYQRNTFRLSHAGEKEKGQAIKTFSDFGAMMDQKHSSTGEGVVVAINSLFNYIFGKDAKLIFDYKQFKESDPLYWEYVKNHQQKGDEWTILMDEPDRNLSLDNLSQIKSILSFHKPQTQMIVVIHNPLLIYSLSKKKGINFIEMTEGYIDRIKEQIKVLVK